MNVAKGHISCKNINIFAVHLHLKKEIWLFRQICQDFADIRIKKTAKITVHCGEHEYSIFDVLGFASASCCHFYQNYQLSESCEILNASSMCNM